MTALKWNCTLQWSSVRKVLVLLQTMSEMPSICWCMWWFQIQNPCMNNQILAGNSMDCYRSAKCRLRMQSPLLSPTPQDNLLAVISPCQAYRSTGNSVLYNFFRFCISLFAMCFRKIIIARNFWLQINMKRLLYLLSKCFCGKIFSSRIESFWKHFYSN